MLMQIDGTILFVIISFLIFLFIIKAILFHPFSKIIDERNNFYIKNSKMENDSKEKSKQLLEEKENKLRQTRIEASNILKKTSDELKEENEKLIKQAKLEAQTKIEKNQQVLEEERIKAKEEIKSEVNMIVSSIASKILKDDIQVTLDNKQIEQYLNI